MQTFLKRTFIVIIAVILCTSLSPVFAYAEDEFEVSISEFPESYKVYLRKLHKDYPDWQFIPLETGLDWYDAVNAQYKENRSLVTASTAYTDIYRSREVKDYNYETGAYIQKDAGFVRANKLAVSYYMDPRNFLKPEGIFQFEKLSFDSSITVEDVETVLKGSFMYNTKAEYIGGKIKEKTDEATGETIYEYVISDKKKTTKEKYSELFYKAGKKYNINPCFLAAKALNEVGTKGSESVSGKQLNYPGVYNFYNVGAYDGSNPTETGLHWASSKGTYAPDSYQRPWISPKRSILGGAEFNAEKYINAGQYTSYLQRFNVDPDCKYDVYTHQYMTNLAGAAHPAYQTYLSYKSNKTLKNKYIFIIPIYENMPSLNTPSGSIYAADSLNQTGKINTDCNVRKGPSVDSELMGIQLASGKQVTIIDTVKTDTKNTDNLMRYPFWCKIQFTSDGKTQTGYVYSNFISLVTQTLVGEGSYIPPAYSDNPELTYSYISDNVNVASVIKDKSLNFKETGKTVNITAYNSTGEYAKVKYKVVKDVSKYTVENITVEEITHNSAVVRFNNNSYFNSYEVLITDNTGSIVQHITTKTNSAAIKNLSFLTDYTVSVRGYKNTSSTKNYGIYCGYIQFTTANTPEKPDAVTDITAVNLELETVLLTWSPVTNAGGYCIYTVDAESEQKTLVAELDASETSYSDISENSLKEVSYIINSYIDIDGRRVYSDDSDTITYMPPQISINRIPSLSVLSYTESTITLSWDASVGSEGYNIYQLNREMNKFQIIGYTNDTVYTVENLKPANEYQYIIKPAIELHGKLYEGDGIKILSRTAPLVTEKISLSDVTTSKYTLKWTAVDGATGYRVYRYDSKSKTYKKYKSTTKNYLKLKKLSAGKKTYYKIMAYTKIDDNIYFGTLSDSFRATTKPSKVKAVKASEVKSSSLKLSWNKAEGATGYRIYRYNSEKNTYKLVGKTSKNYITLNKLTPGKTYKLIVRSVSKTADCKYYGASSSKITVTTKK